MSMWPNDYDGLFNIAWAFDAPQQPNPIDSAQQQSRPRSPRDLTEDERARRDARREENDAERRHEDKRRRRSTTQNLPALAPRPGSSVNPSIFSSTTSSGSSTPIAYNLARNSSLGSLGAVQPPSVGNIPGPGPLIGRHVVPNRPKPGRKPAMDEPMNKRTEQNRMAQRAFRERQKSAQDSLTQQRDHFNEMCVRLQGENDKLFADFQRLETENQTLSAHCDKVDSSLKVLEEESELNRARADQGLHVLSHWQDKVREANLTLHKVTQEMKRKDEELLQRDSMIQQLMARNSEMESELQQYRVQISSQRSSASTAASLTGKFQNLQTTNPNQSGSSFNLLPENPSLSGCGDCGENGDCPCVDNFVSADSTAPGSMGPPLQRSSSSTSMAIGSLLSPSSRPAALPTQGFFQQGASFTQLETDLTFAFKQPEKQLTVDSVMSDLSPNTCGACGPDDKLCLCRNAHNDTGAAASSQSPTAFQTSGAAAMQPGSCDKCQTDPRQRAYCISLAEQATLNSASKRPESFNAQNPDPKRRRISEHMVSCSEAYNITERLSVASTVQSGASEDAFLDAIGEMKEIIGNDGQPRKYSAFEVNIGTVLTSLRGGSSRGLEGELGADHLGI